MHCSRHAPSVQLVPAARSVRPSQQPFRARRWPLRCVASSAAAPGAGKPDSSKADQSFTDLDDFFLGTPPKPANPLGTNGQMPTDPSKSTAAAGQPTIIKSFHIIAYFTVLALGLAFLTILLVSTGDMQLRIAATKVVKRLLKTHALRQLVVILSAMLFVRFGLEPMVKVLRAMFGAQGQWEKSTEFFVLREVYRPLEVLFLIAAAVTFAENFLPQLIAIPKSLVQNIVRSTLSLTFVIALVRVVYNIKGRMFREMAWQLEVKGDVTRQRRVEAIDKIMSVLTLIVGAVFGFQALGLDINSVLTIGGIGGLAVGLAGREILENLFTGLIILSSSPFEVGDEILFRPSSGQVIEGIVVDVGWYRTTIRSFEREIFCIPNAAFSRNVVLNVTRKGKEWRFFEFIGLRVEDMKAVSAVVADMRKIIRQDPRIIQKLHRRVFLDKITREQVTLYVSFYVEAANRDAFMAIKQDLFLAFVDCVERNNAKLAKQRVQLEFAPSVPATLPADSPDDSKPALPAPVDVAATGIPPEPVPPSSNGGGPVVPASVTPASPPSTLASEAAASVVAGGAAAAAKVAVKAKPADATAKAGDGSEASMRNMVTNASNLSSVAAAAAAVALTPDDIFSSHQDGVMVTGSWDEI